MRPRVIPEGSRWATASPPAEVEVDPKICPNYSNYVADKKKMSRKVTLMKMLQKTIYVLALLLLVLILLVQTYKLVEGN